LEKLMPWMNLRINVWSAALALQRFSLEEVLAVVPAPPELVQQELDAMRAGEVLTVVAAEGEAAEQGVKYELGESGVEQIRRELGEDADLERWALSLDLQSRLIMLGKAQVPSSAARAQPLAMAVAAEFLERQWATVALPEACDAGEQFAGERACLRPPPDPLHQHMLGYGHDEISETLLGNCPHSLLFYALRSHLRPLRDRWMKEISERYSHAIVESPRIIDRQERERLLFLMDHARESEPEPRDQETERAYGLVRATISALSGDLREAQRLPVAGFRSDLFRKEALMLRAVAMASWGMLLAIGPPDRKPGGLLQCDVRELAAALFRQIRRRGGRAGTAEIRLSVRRPDPQE
jgi:hypothetical protein